MCDGRDTLVSRPELSTPDRQLTDSVVYMDENKQYKY
jgi:hypothetical protein